MIRRALLFGTHRLSLLRNVVDRIKGKSATPPAHFLIKDKVHFNESQGVACPAKELEEVDGLVC